MGRRTHVLVATFPAQGHINPSLQLAKRLLNAGIKHITFFTSLYAWRRMAKNRTAESPNGLDFVSFSDGYDDGLKPGEDGKNYMSEMKTRGKDSLRNTLNLLAEQGRPVTFIIYSHLFAWAADVAREFHVPTALLWVEPATVLDIYYFYFNGYGPQIDELGVDNQIHLPCLPPLSKNDLPSFLLPSTTERFRLMMKEKLETLDVEEKPKVLVNTFDALERDALAAVKKYEMIAIGPLIPRAFLNGEDPSDRSFGGDLFEKNDDSSYLDWLNKNPKQSVVYISFGSFVNLQKPQLEAIAKALLSCNRPFLWVIREDPQNDDESTSNLRELTKLGKIVPWCTQVEVLSHPSVGCFVTHCGWNSAVEGLAMGVPMVAFPQWFDQATNAKMVEEVWGVGIRVRVDEGGGVGGEELRRCIEEVMRESGRRMREKAALWRGLAREAAAEGGSSGDNLEAFIRQVEDA